MVLRAMRLRIPLRNWLDKEISMDPGLERLALSNMDWKKLKYLINLLRLFAEYTSLIRNTRDATINYTWNLYCSGAGAPLSTPFRFWYSVLCLRTVLGPLRGCGRSEPIGSRDLRNGNGTRISDQSDHWRAAVGWEWYTTVPDWEMGTLHRVLGSPTGPATGAPYTKIGYIAGGSGHSR